MHFSFRQKQRVINGQQFGRCFPLHPPFYPCLTILVGLKWTGVQPVALRLGVIVFAPFQICLCLCGCVCLCAWRCVVATVRLRHFHRTLEQFCLYVYVRKCANEKIEYVCVCTCVYVWGWYINEPCHSFEWDSWHIHECVIARIWPSHDTQMNESCCTDEQFISQQPIWMSHITRTNESGHK